MDDSRDTDTLSLLTDDEAWPQFLEDMEGHTEDGALNLIAAYYVRREKERAESPGLQQRFEASLEGALGVCMKDKRTHTIMDFLANPSISLRIKQGADRFMLGVAREYAKAEDFDSMLALIKKCLLPDKACTFAINSLISAKRFDLVLSALREGNLTENARTIAQKAYAKFEKREEDDSTLVKLLKLGRRKNGTGASAPAGTPRETLFRSGKEESQKKPSRFPPPSNPLFRRDVTTIPPLPPSKAIPLKK